MAATRDAIERAHEKKNAAEKAKEIAVSHQIKRVLDGFQTELSDLAPVQSLLKCRSVLEAASNLRAMSDQD